MNRIDSFITNIYSAVQYRNSPDFREDALRSLGVLIPFDGALWGSGNQEDRLFRSVVTLGMPEDAPGELEKYADSSEILPIVMDNLGTAINVTDVIPDEQYYNSEVYKRCYSRYSIERALIYGEMDERTDIYCFIALYRYDRESGFSEDERETFETAALHMISAARNAFFMYLAHEASENPGTAGALCNSKGQFYQVQPEFLNLLEQNFPDWKGKKLPFDIPRPGEQSLVNGLCATAERYADLFCVRIWEERPTDALSELDQQIVNLVCQGMPFKDIGRELHMAPSTVSNHLYRIYRQLGVSSRAGLARLVRGE